MEMSESLAMATQEGQQTTSSSDRQAVAVPSGHVMMANVEDMIAQEGEQYRAQNGLQLIAGPPMNVAEADMNDMQPQPMMVSNMPNAHHIMRGPPNRFSTVLQSQSLPRLGTSVRLGKRPRIPEGLQFVLGPGKRIKILCEGHDLGVTIGFNHDKSADISVTSRTQEKPYIKYDPLWPHSNQKLASLHAHASEYKRGEFPFMKMPPEIRIIVYKMLMSKDDPYDDTYEAVHDLWCNSSRENTRRGAVMSRSKGSFMIPGFILKSRTWVNGQYEDHYLGNARSLLALNKTMRAEVGQLVFQTMKFDLTSLTVETICEWLLDIGDIGRHNIKNLSIEWWSPTWGSGSRDHLVRPLDAAADLVELLASCAALRYLGVRLPYGNGLGRSRVKPHHFNTHCDLALLRTVTGAKRVRVESPNPALTRWLVAGMTGVNEQNIQIQQDRHYHWARN
ncbi:uncharacterized protein BDZ99DRAFT_527333 [Mytilinidion resinicola]|uniref:Uncharacterized protein n=1 Tax=Mytilinidion resinicola TaxID=574789 RepID=A0A6A6Y309_9PEZI|nr:uncharacterized protein BDZ99DRAFT_527333 [Mytilinidion resinicola]KAF2802605.1 hypothetical protein BDZ99DRAFT_527333 [Mytilinidion resinicola]